MIPRRPRVERGFALLAVLMVLALLGVVGAEFAYSMRLEASAVRAWRDGIAATHLAEAAVEQAVREIVADSQYVGLGEAGVLTFYTRGRTARPRLERDKVALGSGHFSYRISDEQARLDLNGATPDRLDRLLRQLGLDKRARDEIVDSLMDWRDPNDEHRLHGAESDDYYLKLPIPYRARNANLDSVNELLQIRGVTATLFRGTEGKPGLVDFVTVKSQGQVNINTASEQVLRAYALSDAEVSFILQTRQTEPFFTPPSQFGGRGFVVTTQTFRIEAEGFVEGEVQARITAIVKRRADGGGTAGVTYVGWWSGR